MSNEKQKTMSTKTKILYRVDLYNEGSGSLQMWAKTKKACLSCAGIGKSIISNTEGKYLEITSFEVPYHKYKKLEFDPNGMYKGPANCNKINDLWCNADVICTFQFSHE